MNVSCQCGAVAFQTPTKEPLELYICHCQDCRKQSSSAFGCSAIFPIFALPSPEKLECYTKGAEDGQHNPTQCYFCRACGTRLLHVVSGRDTISIKGGCIEGLNWATAKHLWCSVAVMPVPKYVKPADQDQRDGASFGVYTHGDSALKAGKPKKKKLWGIFDI